jgi:hypothetical protein
MPPRDIATARTRELIEALARAADPAATAAAREQCEHLARAIDAFHMEAIRFRMFTLDRLVTTGAVPLDDEGHRLVAELKDALEAAGFHTRSHKAP